MTESPALSVIVVSFNQSSVLRQCLSAFNAQSERDNVEIIVIRDWTGRGDVDSNQTKSESSVLKSEFPQFDWIDAPSAAPFLPCGS